MSPLSLPKFTESIVDDHIRVFEQTTTTDTPRPLAIVLGWLMGKPEHVRKYSEIYLSHGFDVIQVQAYLKDLLFTQNAKKVAEKVLQISEENKRKTQPIFIHALSVGCYISTEILNNSNGNHKNFSTFLERLRGQIFDSPVDAPTAQNAIARGTTKNPLLQGVIKMTSNLFFLAASQSRKDLHNGSKMFKDNVNRIPTLLVYSLGDTLLDFEVLDTMRETQSKRGIDTRCVKWENPSHVAIYRECPEEYRLVVKTFIDEHLSQQICTRL